MPDERFWRDANGRLTFDLPTVEAADYSTVARAVKGLPPSSGPIGR